MATSTRIVPDLAGRTPPAGAQARQFGRRSVRVEAAPRRESMLFRICTLFGCGGMLLGLARPVQAQGFGPADQSRRGFWYSLGVGQGYTDLACGICGGERENGGLSGYARAGGTVTRAFLLGGEVSAWRRSQGELREHMEAVSAAAFWYPHPAHGWYVKFGLGYAMYRANEGDEHLAAKIFSGGLGTGYEMRVSPVLSIAPFVNLMATPSGNLNREVTEGGGYHADRVADDLKLLVVQFGIGVTRH